MEARPAVEGGNYRGWYASALILAVIFVVAALLWFHYHP